MGKKTRNHPTTPVQPLPTLAPYIGGKRNLAKRIVERIEAIPHRTYAEPFLGMGGIFLRRRAAPPLEVVNDYGKDVATFFRILQRHYVPFMEMLKFQVTTRAEFERLVATDPETLTDLERAARFLYLQRITYGGKIMGRVFGFSRHRPARFNITRLAPVLEEVHARLAGVIIERLPYAEFVEKYDTPETLFYLDPPYWGCETYYGRGVFERADFERLAELLKGIQGRFIMSLNDIPEVRKTFRAFRIERVKTTYTAASKGAKQAREVLVSNGSRKPAR